MKKPKATPQTARLWRITNRVTGESLGVFPGADELEALDAAANGGAPAPDDLEDLEVEYDGFQTVLASGAQR
jgi:hypothetical protein